jgi:hypothetical protein
MQAAVTDCQCLDLRSLPKNGFVAPKVDVGGCDVVQALAPLGDARITCRSKASVGYCNTRRRPRFGVRGHQAGNSFPAAHGFSSSGANVRFFLGFAP